jgi:putative ABC transport system permease protein
MNFILKMAWRDSRAARRRLVLFSLSVVLGIAALVAIGSFSANLRVAIDDQARGLLGADLVITSRQAFLPEVTAHLDGLGGEQAREASFSSMMIFPTPEGDRTRLVQVRAVEGRFPFYGEFQARPGDAPAQLADGGPVVLLEETLLSQFGLKPGDTVRLGRVTFTVAGAVLKVPGDSVAITQLAPRAFIPLGQLPATELAGPGSLVRHRIALKLPPEVDPAAVERDMRQKFITERMSYDTVEERKRDLGRVLENVNGFLSLVGFVALFLGAIGVASAIHVYIRQKITTVAVLRCLGASARQSFAVYLVQGLGLGVLGSVLGAALGVAVQLALPAAMAGLLPFDVDFFISWTAVARGMGAGLVICVLFTLLPLLAVRRVSPLVALRAAFADRPERPDPWRIALGVLLVAAIAGFAVEQTRSLALGLGFTGALAAGFAVLAGLAKAVAWAARRWLPRGLPYVVRQGVANLHRPNNRTVLLLLALGLGTFLITTLYLTRSTLLAQIQGTGGAGRPNLLFFDIQDDQIGPLNALLRDAGHPATQQAPIVTMRLRSLRGQAVEDLLKQPDNRIPGWTLRREYRSTYRADLTDTETLLSGEIVPRVAPEEEIVPITIEEGLARDMQLQLGDEVEFDVQGVAVRTRLAGIRKVDWQRLQPNFFIVFPEGVLEEAPQFYVAALRIDTAADSARLQQMVVRALPNVSAIDLTLLLETFDTIFGKVALVVQFMAFFTVATGIIVLAGAVLTGRWQRIRETVLLRTLGATRRQLVQIQLVEYAILGVLAAVVGCLLAVGGNLLLAKFVFKTAATPDLLTLGLAVLAVSVITLLTGLLSNRGVADHPPLEILRQET